MVSDTDASIDHGAMMVEPHNTGIAESTVGGQGRSHYFASFAETGLVDVTLLELSFGVVYSIVVSGQTTDFRAVVSPRIDVARVTPGDIKHERL